MGNCNSSFKGTTFNQVTDLKVVYTGCPFTCGDMSVETGDSLSHAFEVLKECQGADIAFVSVDGYELPTPLSDLAYTNFLSPGTYTHESGDIVIADGTVGILNWVNDSWYLTQVMDLSILEITEETIEW